MAGMFGWVFGFFLHFVKTKKFNVVCNECEHLSIVILVGYCAVMREARRWQHYVACPLESESKMLLKYGALDNWHTWKIYSLYVHVVDFSISVSLHYLPFHIRSKHL